MTASHRQLDHTADLAFEVRAGDEAALLAEGARVLVGVLTDGTEVVGDDERTVAIEAADGPDRLVLWLSEVLVLAQVDGFLACSFDVELSPGGLSARLRGRGGAWDLLRREVKAVTWHDVAVERRGRAWIARFVLDV